ncbi:biotin-ligase [Agrocybe pediades]|nr:biotin-ligase [Agrocybe pediades]
MNVLVYAGPEILQVSLNHTLLSLRSILVPHYTVQPITRQALSLEPWQKSCALLVLPRCRTRFVSATNKHIKDFVELGGKCLLLGASATAFPRSGGLGIGASSLTFGQEEGAETPLRFYDKFNNCYINCNEEVDETPSGSVCSLQASNSITIGGIYHLNDAKLKGFNELKGVSILAKEGDETVGLSMDISKGRLALWGPNVEYPLDEEPTSSLIAQQLSVEEIGKFDKLRRQLIRTTLSQLGLQIPEEKQSITRPLPQFLTASPSKPDIISRTLEAIAAPQSGEQLTVLKDSNDEFYFYPLQEGPERLQAARKKSQTPSDPSTWQPKDIVVCRDGKIPSSDLTPLFDVELYYQTLAALREKAGLKSSSESWGIGECLLYGEVVTSTQTMLDKNPHLLSYLPTPFLSLASYQLAGRGRGSNVWLSPAGCLQFSLLLRVKLSELPAPKLVFVQYLFSLAVVEACRDNTILGPKFGEKIKIKWPNDIYASVGMGKDDIRKIGGVLVNTSFSGQSVDLVIGCGLNVLNLPPITSLSQLQPDSQVSLSMEKTAAAIMTKFESMWTTFIETRGSFNPFMSLYLERWLHSCV